MSQKILSTKKLTNSTNNLEEILNTKKEELQKLADQFNQYEKAKQELVKVILMLQGEVRILNKLIKEK